MKTLFFTSFVSLLLFAGSAFASDILVLQSLRVKPFDDALRGFKSVTKVDSRTVLLSEKDVTDIAMLVRAERPRLILAIGADALKSVKWIKDIPIIYIMVLNPDRIAGEGKNIVGINMNIPPERYLELMEKVNMDRLKVGVFYDPTKTGAFMKRILQTAGSRDIAITAVEVHSPKEIPETFKRMKSAFNIFWMLPDSTVVTPETVEFILLQTEKIGLPVVAFAGKYVESGALFSLDIDGFDMGNQAGEMANNILDGASVSEIANADARKSVLKVNRNVAKKLGISLHSIETFISLN